MFFRIPMGWRAAWFTLGSSRGLFFGYPNFAKLPFSEKEPNSEKTRHGPLLPSFRPKTRSLDFRRPQIFEQQSKNVDLFGSFFGFDFSRSLVFPLLPNGLFVPTSGRQNAHFGTPKTQTPRTNSCKGSCKTSTQNSELPKRMTPLRRCGGLASAS